jgi:hypothetical protein
MIGESAPTVGRGQLPLGAGDVIAILPVALLWVLNTRAGVTLNLFESGTFLAGGQHQLHGHMLYSHVFAFYGPLAYLEPYLAARLLGHNDLGLLVPDLVVSALLCWTAYRLARRLSGRNWLSLVAPWVIAAQGSATPRTFTALIALLTLSHYEGDQRIRWLFASGGTAALATLWFQDAGVWVTIGIATAAVLAMIRRCRVVLAPRRAILGWTLGFGAVVAPVVVTFATTGALLKWLYYCFIFTNTAYTHRSATGYVHSLVTSWRGLPLQRCSTSTPSTLRRTR